jgi:hypothetical protein
MAKQDGVQPWRVSRPAYIKVLREAVTLRVVIGTLIVVGLGLVVIAVSYTSAFDPPDDSWLTFSVRQIGAGFLVVAIVNLVLQVFVERYRQQLSGGLESFLKEDVTQDLRRIQADINDQAQVLLDGSATLAALVTSGVSQIYASRGEATDIIKRDVETPGVRRIRIMGISLNDFLRSDQHENLHAVWRVITSYVRRERTSPHGLDIRVLIIDPNCCGALLRSYGEARLDDQLSGRLDEDVKATAARLGDLVNEARSRAEGDGTARVSFDFRLYRLAPTMFLCSTDNVSYVQPYYFWSRRQFDVTIPVMRLEGTPLQAAMADHFDLIWETASVDGTAWLNANEVGIDKGAMEAGTVNIFTTPGQGYDRMRWLISHAQKRVWLQGISLKSFFEPGKLYAELRQALKRNDVDVRILLLNPDSEQARYRSYREHDFSDHCATHYTSYTEYQQAVECHADSTLSHDTRTTIKKIRGSLGSACANQARLYSTAPSCFVLIVDNVVLVEQYHLGKAVPSEFRLEDQGVPPILGKDMALVEYSKQPSVLVDQDESRHPYDLLVDHFLFVYDHCSIPIT